MAWITLKQLADRLGKTKRQVDLMRQNGEIEAVKRPQKRGAPAWMVDDSAFDWGTPTPPPSNLELADAAELQRAKAIAQIRKLEQQLSESRDKIIADVWNDLTAAAEWLIDPLRQTIADLDLTADQQEAINTALHATADRVQQLRQANQDDA